MQPYPLIYSFRDVVSGQGFLAGVQVQGFALLEHEDGAWWMTGVQPSGLADYGSTEAEAYAEFRASFREVLFGLAETSPTFEVFEAEVNGLFGQSTDSKLQRWLDARAAIRAGQSPSGSYVADLPRVTRDNVVPQLKLDRLDRVEPQAFKPDQNEADCLESAA